MLTALLAVFVIGVLAGCGGPKGPDADVAVMPASSSGFAKQSYEKVVADLADAGFTNVTALGLEDLVLGLFAKADHVKEVTVDEYTDYKRGDEFPKDAAVIVSYHSYPETTEELETEPNPEPEESSESASEGLEKSEEPEKVDRVEEEDNEVDKPATARDDLAKSVRARWLEIFGVEKEMDLMDLYLEDPYAPTFAITEWEDVSGGWVRIYIQLDIGDEEALNSGKQILGLTCEEYPELKGIVVRGTDGIDRNIHRHDMPLCEIADRG